MEKETFSLEKRHIVVNYHYVEDRSENFLGIHPCSVEEFEHQVSSLSRNYRITSVPEVFTAARNSASERTCALTFDDGLKDQYANALPILKRYQASATFFIITKALEGFIPATHKAHMLLSMQSAEALIDRSNEFLRKRYPDQADRYVIPKDRRLTLKRKLRDDIQTANFKEATNILPFHVTEELLCWIFEREKVDEDKLARELFMNANEIKDLTHQGHRIGSHAHSHRALEHLSEKEMYDDISQSQAALTDLIGGMPTVFSYPHGGSSKAVRQALKKTGCPYAVTNNERAVGAGDDPLLIPRFDTVTVKTFLDLPLGQQNDKHYAVS